MSTKVNMQTDEILGMAKDFFDGQFGLSVHDDIPNCCLEFTGELGFVSVHVLDEGVQKEVILTTREFEVQIQAFLGTLQNAS